MHCRFPLLHGFDHAIFRLTGIARSNVRSTTTFEHVPGHVGISQISLRVWRRCRMSETTDPRIDAIRQHFHEWHGAAPDDTEIAALLKSIDRAAFMAALKELANGN